MLFTLTMALAATGEAAWRPIGNVDVFTSFPTEVGVRGTLEGLGRVRATGSAGLLPRPYLDAINDTATAFEWYDEPTAQIVDAALQDALVVRAHLGWRPFPKLGFQFELGYGWIGLGGGITGAEIIEAETGYDLGEILGDSYNFSAAAELHRVDLSFGWEHVFGRHFLLRWDLGASYTFAATAEIHRDFDTPRIFDGFFDEVEDKGEDDLVRILQQYVHTPIIAVGVGWRFS
jgi:hypothetical protein